MIGIPPNERYVFEPDNVVSNPLQLGNVFFINRTENENRIEELPMNARIEKLMKAPITPYAVTGDYLRVLLRLANSGCHILHYSDMGYVQKVVRERIF